MNSLTHSLYKEVTITSGKKRSDRVIRVQSASPIKEFTEQELKWCLTEKERYDEPFDIKRGKESKTIFKQPEWVDGSAKQVVRKLKKKDRKTSIFVT